MLKPPCLKLKPLFLMQEPPFLLVKTTSFSPPSIPEKEPKKHGGKAWISAWASAASPAASPRSLDVENDGEKDGKNPGKPRKTHGNQGKTLGKIWRNHENSGFNRWKTISKQTKRSRNDELLATWWFVVENLWRKQKQQGQLQQGYTAVLIFTRPLAIL